MSLTDDELERDLLTADHADVVEPDDQCTLEMSRIAHELQSRRLKIPARQRRCIPYLMSGMTDVDIARQLGIAASTVARARRQHHVRRYMALLLRRERIMTGPTEAQRMALLWRIAKREEYDRPAIAIRAIDVLNRQTGSYIHEEQAATGVVVNINQFRMDGSAPPATVPARRVETVEGDYTVVSFDDD
jgi:DNA-binding CsgD family transcriptional regulator